MERKWTVLSGLAPPPLANEGSVGYRAASQTGMDEDAVLGIWIAGRHGATRAHRPGLSPVPLPRQSLCCTGLDRGRIGPYPVRGQAVRTYFGRPNSSMRLRAWTPTLTSVTRRPSVRERSPSPITCLSRPTVASARARAL